MRGRLRQIQDRWQAGPVQFVLLVSLGNLALYHFPLYAFARGNLDLPSLHGFLTLSTLLVTVFVATATLLFVTLALARRLVKPVCMFVAVGNSVALYFVVTYQVVLDRTMMGNVFNTDFQEAASYLHPKLLLYVALLGVLPALLLTRIRIGEGEFRRLAAGALVTLTVGLGWIYAASGSWLWIDQHAKKLGGMVLPWSYLVNAVRYQSSRIEIANRSEPLPPATFTHQGKRLVVLVIGEAARAQNFALYGYEQPTNPGLSERQVVALTDTTACATYTTAAIACMLSSTGSASDGLEPLPNYLQRQGVEVIWRANNWGAPVLHVASYQRSRDLRAHCSGDGCEHDEVLLTGLSEQIRASESRNILVVLHLRGSHGPAYYSEYPPGFEVFSPVCESVDLNECSPESLENAYDNTLVYTDHVLSRTIDLIEALSDLPSVFLYVSDHGESLGEFGLYLHGTPWSLAPQVQKSIPFVVWMSKAFMDEKGISNADLNRNPHHSQANVFHSVMGAFGMVGPAYDRELDVFSTEDLQAGGDQQ